MLSQTANRIRIKFCDIATGYLDNMPDRNKIDQIGVISVLYIILDITDSIFSVFLMISSGPGPARAPVSARAETRFFFKKKPEISELIEVDL